MAHKKQAAHPVTVATPQVVVSALSFMAAKPLFRETLLCVSAAINSGRVRVLVKAKITQFLQQPKAL